MATGGDRNAVCSVTAVSAPNQTMSMSSALTTG